MDSCNIESDNVDGLEIQPLKKARWSESTDFESDKHMSEQDTSLSPPSQNTDCYTVESSDLEKEKCLVSFPLQKTESSLSSEEKYSESNEQMNGYCKQLGEYEQSKIEQTYDYPPQDSSQEQCSESNEQMNGHGKQLDEYEQLVIPQDSSQEKCSKSNEQMHGHCKQLGEYEQLGICQTYDYLPQDYTITDMDYLALLTIGSSSATDILVKIDDIFVTQAQLLCLLDLKKFVNDDVISAYICCIKDQAHQRSSHGVKFYFENPFISVILKAAGSLGMNKDINYVTDIVRDYLKHDMVLIPINIKDIHWYLAVINAKKCEIQVLDSLCWEFNRTELTATVQGLQYHLDIIEREGNLISHNWKNLKVTTWTITEQLQEPVQKDNSSCGLFMLKFMEYWTGDTLSHYITQEEISLFRSKLGAILYYWKTNTAEMTPNSEETYGNVDDCSGVTILESPNGRQESQALDSLSDETNYHSLMSVLSKMGVHELVCGLCNYIKSINCTVTLEKVWVQNSKPYSISLSLKKLQEILKEDQPLDRDCFNLIVRKFMFNDNQMVKKRKDTHYLDLKFWMTTDFLRHPDFRKKLDVDGLIESVRSWPGVNYCVSKCKTILMPIETLGAYILIILHKDTKTVYILDPTPLQPIFKYNPSAKYVKKLLWVAEYLSKAMSKAYPGSNWSEDIFLWRQVILSDVPIQRRELSGFLVSLFMCEWKDKELRLPILKVQDGNELRKQFLVKLLSYQENECKDNMPSGVQDFIRCINTVQS